MKKLNIKRMRNYIFKSTPDRKVVTFSRDDEDIERLANNAMHEFNMRMRKKHVQNVRVYMSTDDRLEDNRLVLTMFCRT